MKIFKTLYFCFAIFFIILSVYLEFYIKLVSFYWLIAELAGILFIVTGRVVIDILEGVNRGRKIFFQTIFVSIILGYFGYLVISNYKRNVCQAQFGPEFNAKRRSLGTPIIPEKWQIKESSEGRVRWAPADSLIGHQKKYIYIDTGCAIEEELDYYGLTSQHGNKREVMIETQFGRGRLNDSVFYYYYHDDAGRRADTITRQQADSIFAAEKIRKDY